MGQATSEGNEVIKDETPFRYAHAEIWTQVVVICDTTRYQLDHTGALRDHHAQQDITTLYICLFLDKKCSSVS